MGLRTPATPLALPPDVVVLVEWRSNNAIEWARGMGGSDLTYKPPQQRRSRESLERILDAAESLIRERGFDSMTIADVVQRSGSSVGSLYARFDNKIGLLQAVQLRYHARVQNAIFAAFSGDHPRDESLEEAVGRIVSVLCRHVLNEPELFRAFVLEAVFDSGVRAQGSAPTPSGATSSSTSCSPIVTRSTTAIPSRPRVGRTPRAWRC